MYRMGLKDGSMRGWKMGGRGRNRVSQCRYKKNTKVYEDSDVAEDVSNKVIKNMIGDEK